MNRNILNKIKKIPKIIFFITIFFISLPLLINNLYSVNNLNHMEFFFLLIPTFFWSYYLGLVGGLFSVFFTTLLFLGDQWYEINYLGIVHQTDELFIIYAIAAINLVIPIGVGFLADRLIRKNEMLETIVITDSLTQLNNRWYILNILKSIDSNDRASVIFIDLDNFKNINDTLGHEVGDIMLQEVGKRLRSIITEDNIARIGGDEFVILSTQNIRPKDIIQIANKVRYLLAEPFIIKGQTIFTTVSIGISTYPDHTDSPEQLVNNADIAMYHAKNSGKNQIQNYSKEIETVFFNNARLEQEIHSAIDNDQFVIYYQPKFELKNSEIIGMEALIRWQHPRLGLLSPMSFIPTAEQTNLIVPIGEWVIRHVCFQMSDWQKKGLKTLRTSVNVSARQFNLKFVDTIKEIMQETNINPNLLEIEITESVLMNDVNEAVKVLEELSQLGFYISIDDFGTGYSSLNYLNKLPVNCLKIDKSFVSETLNAKSIIDTMIMLGHNLHFDVLAEGIETVEQLNYLKELHCDYGQGYLFSYPLPAKNLEQIFLSK